MAIKIYRDGSFVVIERNGLTQRKASSQTGVSYDTIANTISVTAGGTVSSAFGIGASAPTLLSAADNIPFADMAAAKTYLDTVFIDASAGGGTDASAITTGTLNSDRLNVSGDALIENSAHVAFWGDSLTATLGAYDNTIPYQYGLLSKQTIFNGGIGGQRSDQIKARFIAFANKNWGQMFWEGKNDDLQAIAPSVTLQNVADQIALLTHNRYVVIGVIKSNPETTGTAGAIRVDAINAGYASAYGVRYFDVNAYLRTQGDGSANDIADVAAGIIPRSLMQADGIHLNAKANGLVATKLFTDYGQYLVTTEKKVITSNNSPALNVSNLPQFSLAKGGKYQIGGGQVLYLPDQTVNTQCIFVGNGGSELLGVNAKQDTGLGVDAFYNLINGIGNVAIGSAAMYFAVNNTACTAVGGSALNKATGNNNTAVGNSAGLGIVAGIENTVMGRNAMSGANGSGNSLIGDVAGGLGATAFSNNTGVGWHIFINVTGSNNTGLGSGVGTNLTSGSKNLIIGKDIEFVSNTASNQVVIANLIDGLGATGTGTTMAGTLGLGRRATATAYVSFPASTTTIASQNITAGVAPTTPVDGDMWFIGDVMYRRIAGVTKQLTFA